MGTLSQTNRGISGSTVKGVSANRLRTTLSHMKDPYQSEAKTHHSRDTVQDRVLLNTMYSQMQDFTNRSQDSPHKFQEDSDSALASIVSSIQCKLDLLINDKNYKLPQNSQPEKEFLKKVKNSLREFIHPEEGAGSKQRLLQRNDIRTCLNEIQATMFDIESLKILKQSHFEIFSSLIGSIEYSLVDFKKVCSIRGSILELSYKMLFVLMSSMIDKLLIYGDTVEKQIWTQVNKMNSTIEAQIEKISVQLAESRLREEDWKKKVELSKSETFYLAKMIRHVENNSKNVIAQMKALELEKSILANDLVNVKLELLQQKAVQRDAMYNQKGSPMRLNSSNNLGNSPGVTSHQIIPSQNQPNDELSGEPQLLSDEVHVRWQKLKDSIETQLQAKKYYLTEFEREMVNLINNGLERVKKNGITYEGKINERGQCTVDLEPGAKGDKQTQTTLKVIEQEGLKPLTADAECQASYVEMVKLQTANDHKMDSKVISRFSLIYQIKECLSLRELVDEYIFNPLNSKHPKRLDTRKMITDQLSYIIVHKDLVMKITDALDGVETLKIKYNSIGETLTTLKEENKKLQANNAEYENQNHDMTKRMEELRNKLAEAERAPPPPTSAPAKIDSKALVDRINKEELTMLVADYVIEIKDKLLQCITSEDLQSNGQDKAPPSRHSIFRRDSVNAAGKKDKKPEGLPQKFLHAVKPYCEYENQEKQEVMSIDDEEEVDLINEDATPCTIFITKLLNMLKVSLAEKQPTIGIIANKGSDTKLSRVKTIEESVDSTKGIKTISQIIQMKSLAKRIRLAVLNSNPDFKTASDILQEILSRKERTASMPQHSVITLIADIYMSILFEMKVDAETESNTKYPMFYYAYMHIFSLYEVQNLAKSKFKSFIESVMALKVNQDTLIGSEQHNNKILLFSKFLVVEDKWESEFLDIFLMIIYRIENCSDLLKSPEIVTEVKFSELSDIALSPDICRLNLENRNNLLLYMELSKYSRSDDKDSEYKIKLEPTVLHYRFLLKQQFSLVGSLLNDIYIIGATEQRKSAQFLECWEFLMIMEYIQPDYKREEYKEMFYKHADLSIQGKNEQVMSLSRFAKLCMMKNLLSKRHQNLFMKKYKVLSSSNFNFDVFCNKFRSEYMHKISNTFMKNEVNEVDEKRLIDNINFALTHRHYFSMKGIQSTFAMLTNKANKVYCEYLVKNTIFPDEYFPFMQFYEKWQQKAEENKIKAIGPESLETAFMENLGGKLKVSYGTILSN